MKLNSLLEIRNNSKNLQPMSVIQQTRSGLKDVPSAYAANGNVNLRFQKKQVVNNAAKANTEPQQWIALKP